MSDPARWMLNVNGLEVELPGSLVLVGRSDLDLLAKGAAHAAHGLEGLKLDPKNEEHRDAIIARKSAREVEQALGDPDRYAVTEIHFVPTDTQ